MKLRKLLHIILALSLVLVFVAPSLFIRQAQAGTFTLAKVTISDSRAAAGSVSYDFSLTATSSAAIKQIDINFCTTSSGSCTAPPGFNTGTPNLVSDTISGTDRTVSKIADADNTIRVVVTDMAEQQSPTDFVMNFNGITNPTNAGSIYARINSYSDEGITLIDNVVVASAILTYESIKVTADVSSVFTFTVAAQNTGSVNGKAINVTSADSTIPFGTLSNGAEKVAAHVLSVTTNATNGYQITVAAGANPPLSSPGGDNIDNFTGSNTIPTVWSTPTSDTPNTNTGFFGYTTEDFTLTNVGDGIARFQGDKWAGFTTTPAELVYNNSAPEGTEDTVVGWQAEVDTNQPAGEYSGSLTLVATPTY
jgi:hypothetical protein